ncbi:hypothetical protein A3B42_05080 [Candidatus Daviesbacteria bacterium RIFCSPLOWO2_01_FULL_38_10]|nr:MAG: hypothetical protein US80_C0007G0013 [Candidatus Daviesbacteria bacterium GW2011_GWA2_38_17]OGE27857.1 MAG: hypothetical protein A3D02_03790 [Candidatus Daviesbacteria bacterium RIFCSPHIGHO2_02_FULL_39_41]OGE38967.1 MAG: hypothetical protein A3B42_05080 [Candidatus Daviesbacteria bacterium RIFCSPLOWO2_01_FULL_38_10]OGE45053.1 MAG: hypothetical protein A3E67_00870 [Candidatus Daviesbacteria bacterium RIFCSPHIGHO2_12_FULL_38_25]OGE67537.1 MAG: hypothetical protein A3H81_00815 [Candidatus 
MARSREKGEFNTRNIQMRVVLEGLIDQGREPMLGGDGLEGGRRVRFCWIPPKDAQAGDTAYFRVGTWWFLSPEGQPRSHPGFLVLAPIQGRRVEALTRDILQERGIDYDEHMLPESQGT